MMINESNGVQNREDNEWVESPDACPLNKFLTEAEPAWYNDNWDKTLIDWIDYYRRIKGYVVVPMGVSNDDAIDLHELDLALLKLLDSLDQPFIVDLTGTLIPTEGVQTLVRNPFLRGVVLSWCFVSVEDLAILSSAPNLELLTLPHDSTGFSELLTSFPALESLDLLEVDWSLEKPDAFATLCGLTRLKRLAFNAKKVIDNAKFRQLASLDKLESLIVESGFLLTEEGLSVLKELPCLTDLKLDFGGTKHWDAICDLLCMLPALRRLALFGTWGLTNDNLRQLSRLACPEALALELAGRSKKKYADPNDPGYVTADGIRYLSSLTSLKELSLLSCFRLTDQAVEPLANLFRLEKLDIDYGFRLTDTGMKSIARMKSLESLNLGAIPRVTDEGIAALSELPELESLAFASCSLTDEGIDHIVRLPRLKRLSFSKCRIITGTGVRRLASVDTLEELSVQRCRRVRQKDVDELRALMPHCRIHWEAGNSWQMELFVNLFIICFLGVFVWGIGTVLVSTGKLLWRALSFVLGL